MICDFQTFEELLSQHKNIEVTYTDGKPVKVKLVDSKREHFGSTWDTTYHVIYRLTPQPHARWVGKEEITSNWANS